MSNAMAKFESAMEAALRPGRLIDYNAGWDFVRGVEEVAAQVKGLIDEDQAATAVALYETFIAASYEKADEIDDSSGGFGTFVADLFCDWVRARQAASTDPGDTVDILLTWMDNDDYGFCHRLERDLVKVLDADGLSVFATRVRARCTSSQPKVRTFSTGSTSSTTTVLWAVAPRKCCRTTRS